MDSLDILASRMLMRARQVERALHDPGPWTVRVDETEHLARRVIGEDHITFYALLPATRSDIVELTCAGDSVAVSAMGPFDGEFQIEWAFLVEDTVAA